MHVHMHIMAHLMERRGMIGRLEKKKGKVRIPRYAPRSMTDMRMIF